jgi:uncharacterized membrane protein YhaH (DUF805 family)
MLVAFAITFVTWFIVAQANPESEVFAWAFSGYLTATMLPTWAVFVRRLHDVGLSGWLMLLAFVPLVGPLFVIIVGVQVQDSQPGPNRFGPNPKGVNPPEAQAITTAMTT